MEKRFFATPQFWVNVITLVFVGFLVATFVFGWNPPTAPPPGGNSAILVAGNQDIFVTEKNSPLAGRRYIENLETVPQQSNPFNPATNPFTNHVATVGYVEAAVEAGGGGGTGGLLVTLWGRCTGATASDCLGGQGAPQCLATLGTGWSEVYKGFGPYTIVANYQSGQNIVPMFSQLPICLQNDLTLDPSPLNDSSKKPVFLAGNSSQQLYQATWQFNANTVMANTCRVCKK